MRGVQIIQGGSKCLQKLHVSLALESMFHGLFRYSFCYFSFVAHPNLARSFKGKYPLNFPPSLIKNPDSVLDNVHEPGNVGINEAVLCTSFRHWWYKLITGETNFGACVWRRHGGSIVLTAKQRNPILGVKNKFLWKITTVIEFYAQILTYMSIFMNFWQLSLNLE